MAELADCCHFFLFLSLRSPSSRSSHSRYTYQISSKSKTKFITSSYSYLLTASQPFCCWLVFVQKKGVDKKGVDPKKELLQGSGPAKVRVYLAS